MRVSFTDPAVVKFAKEGLSAILNRGVDAIFCNAEEAALFADADGDADPVNTLLKYSDLVVITNSDKPTTIACRIDDRIIEHHIDSCVVSQVIDTNGAGDNYAGAFYMVYRKILICQIVDAWRRLWRQLWWVSLDHD